MSFKGYIKQGQILARRGRAWKAPKTEPTCLFDIIKDAGFVSEDFIPKNEAQLSMLFVGHLREATLNKRLNAVWFHIPNEGVRTGRTGASLKKQGMLAGIADYAFLWASGGGFIEFKFNTEKVRVSKKTGKISKYIQRSYQQPSQEIIQKWSESLGVKYALCYSVDEALQALRQWGVLV